MNVTEVIKLVVCATIASATTAAIINKPSDVIKAKTIRLTDDYGKVAIELDGSKHSVAVYDAGGRYKAFEVTPVPFSDAVALYLVAGKETVVLSASSQGSVVRLDGKNGYIGLSSDNAIKIK